MSHSTLGLHTHNHTGLASSQAHGSHLAQSSGSKVALLLFFLLPFEGTQFGLSYAVPVWGGEAIQLASQSLHCP